MLLHGTLRLCSGFHQAIRNSRLVEQFDAKPAEIKAMLSNSLEPARVAELREKMLYADLPI